MPLSVDKVISGAVSCQVDSCVSLAEAVGVWWGSLKLQSVSPGDVRVGRRCRYDVKVQCFMQGRCSQCRLYDPSLDKYGSSSDVEREVSCEAVGVKSAVSGVVVGPRDIPWNRQQKRGYHRALTCMEYWRENGYQMVWVMLSSSEASDSKLLADHHDRLRKMVERRGFPKLEHYQIRTGEGNGVLHVIWAWKAEGGFRDKAFWVGQRWLSAAWDKLHRARVVWICRIGTRRKDTFKVARYCIGQYVGEQSGYEYMSYSWKRSFGFPVVACWRKFKELFASMYEVKREWSRFLGRHLVWCGFGGFCMGSVRLGYQGYGREFWDMLHWF